jgi:hypothetical protein
MTLSARVIDSNVSLWPDFLYRMGMHSNNIEIRKLDAKYFVSAGS